MNLKNFNRMQSYIKQNLNDEGSSRYEYQKKMKINHNNLELIQLQTR